MTALPVLAVPVFEDAAQAHGTSLSVHYVGTQGTIGTFSTHARKLICTGEGGFCLTGDPALADRLRQLRNLEPDENPAEAALREVAEETGLAVRRRAAVVACTAPPAVRASTRHTPFLCRSWAISTSPPRPSDSSSTDSITVCSTPSARRHTLVVRTPSPS